MNNIKPKLIVILGPTASGKTKLGVKLCSKFNGEIVSADSRQVYKGMDVGTGKDIRDYCLKLPITNYQLPITKISNSKSQILNKSKIKNSKFKKYRIVKIPYHLIDIVNPKKRFNLDQYQKMAFQAIDDILLRKKQPFLVGGTGLYIQSIVDNYDLSDAKPNIKLRKRLESLSIDKLIEKFKITNQKFSACAKASSYAVASANKSADKQINSKSKSQNSKLFDNILQNNKRRIIRYIELMEQKKLCFDKIFKKNKPKYDFLILGIACQKEDLDKLISKRLKKWLEKENLIGEVKNLQKKGVSWKRMEEFGLEYKWISLYLRKKVSYQEMQEFILKDIKKFAKRQMTWFKRDKRIKWIKNQKEAEKLVKKFLKK